MRYAKIGEFGVDKDSYIRVSSFQEENLSYQLTNERRIMKATACTKSIALAMAAGKDRTQRMPFSMPELYMGMGATIASIILIETVAMTASVSSLMPLLSLALILAVVLLSILLSLVLSGLTGLEISDLVGLAPVDELSRRAAKGA